MKFEYEVRRSRRRTLCVRVNEDNTITVSCPYRTTDAQIESFLENKRKWIEGCLSRNAKRFNNLQGISSYDRILVAGTAVPLELGAAKSSFSQEGVAVKSFGGLKKLYVENLGGEFLSLYGKICFESGLKGKSVNFKAYKSRWGCCSSAGDITFNYKLLMLPREFWAYVIAHELCHTVYLNHSPKFYNLLARVMPDYRAFRQKIKDYSLIAKMYC